MNEADFFTLIYPFVPLVGLSGYIPQILKLFALQECPQSFSLLTWYIWLSAWVISLGYTYFAISDYMLCITAGINTLAHTLIIAIVHFKTLKYQASKAPSARALNPR